MSIENGYLPKFMRDFHNQKDLFKLIQEESPETQDYYKITWVQAHVYTVDTFLRFMNEHGYRLRKVNKDAPSIEEEIIINNKRRQGIIAKALKTAIKENEA